MARLKDKYRNEIVASLMTQCHLANPMQVPRVEKVCLNIGLGGGKSDPRVLESGRKVLAMITGQQPVVTKAKKSIAGFHLRAGMTIGCRVTLRGDRMYEFLDRLFNLAMPQIRDFQGASPDHFDGHGNYTLTLRDQMVFPEISFEDAMKGCGLAVTIVTTADNNEEARALLSSLGMPFGKTA